MPSLLDGNWMTAGAVVEKLPEKVRTLAVYRRTHWWSKWWELVLVFGPEDRAAFVYPGRLVLGWEGDGRPPARIKLVHGLPGEKDAFCRVEIMSAVEFRTVKLRG